MILDFNAYLVPFAFRRLRHQTASELLKLMDSKGIGRACAEVLAEEGCDVVLVSRTAADLEAARAAIVAKHNVAVRYYSLDLSDSRNVDKLAAECAGTTAP